MVTMPFRMRDPKTVRRKRRKKMRHITPRNPSLIPSLLQLLGWLRVAPRVEGVDVEEVEEAGGRKRGKRM